MNPPFATLWLTTNTFMTPIFFAPFILVLVGLVTRERWTKFLAVLLIPVALISAFFGLGSLIFPELDANSTKRALISSEFKAIHSFAQKRNLRVVAVHLADPVMNEPEVVIIDRTAFSPTNRTYEDTPTLQGAFEDLAKDGSAHRYKSLEELFSQQGLDLTVRSFNQTIKSMKKLGIHKFIKDPDSGTIVYAWSSGWPMDDAVGLVYAPSGSIPPAASKNFQDSEIRFRRLNKFFFSWHGRYGFFWPGVDNS